ncbi:MAG: hypothetical protein KKF77_04875 [Proteobacteria bacterium]|nr:hypothetical protein [Pseudomonadota bacterium]
MWSHVSLKDIPPAVLMLAVLTIYFDLTTAIILVAVLVVGVAAARRDMGAGQ